VARRMIGLLVVLLAFAVPALAQSIRISNPDLSNYQLDDLSLLIPQIVALSDAVENSGLGSRHIASSEDWDAEQFALYTRGVLESLGYEASLAASPTDPSRIWVIVKIPLWSTTARVPVDPTPPGEDPQTSLGSVPWQRGPSGFQFDSAYATYVPLPTPKNQPPHAELYPPKSPLQEGNQLTFRSVGSSDPDGRIVLYVWDYDDGTTSVTTDGTSVHVYGSGGGFTVRLTVIDDAGAMTKTSAHIYLLAEYQHCAACGI
jgi:hypothetical protein